LLEGGEGAVLSNAFLKSTRRGGEEKNSQSVLEIEL
jgi:hypothetical protein